MDASLEGRRGEPFRMVVEEGKIAEFARAVQSSQPEHFLAGEAISPPTFLMAAAHWRDQASSAMHGIEIDIARILHGEQEFIFHGEPPRAGTTLTGQERIDEVFEKQGKRGGTMTFVKIVTEFTDGSGQVVAETKSTIIQTGQPATTDKADQA